ncbi:MAG: hypothetical protein ACE5LD_02640 [Candidatus Bipolaricaulia bacterium]
MERMPGWLITRGKSAGAMAGAGLLVGLISSAFFGDTGFGALAGLGIGALIGFAFPPLFERR